MKRFLVALGLILAGAAAALTYWLDAAVEAGIETLGPRFTGTPVKVRKVHLSPLSGKGRVQGLSVGNPRGFTAPHALKLGLVRVRLDPRSLLTDRVVIKELLIVGPEVDYEPRLGGSNLSALLESVERASGPEPRQRGRKGSQRKVVIERLIVTEGKVRLGAAATVALPDIELKDIGKASGGATVKAAVEQALGAVLRAAAGAQGVSKTVGQAAGSVSRSLKSLFRRKK